MVLAAARLFFVIECIWAGYRLAHVMYLRPDALGHPMMMNGSDEAHAFALLAVRIRRLPECLRCRGHRVDSTFAICVYYKISTHDLW